MRQSGKWCIDRYRRAACVDLSVICGPVSWRKGHFARSRAFLHDWRDEKIGAHHEFVYDGSISMPGEVVLEAAKDRLPVLSRLFCQSGKLWRELLAKRNHIREDCLMALVEDAPRRSRYLHHRTERVYLRGADKQFRVKRRAWNERSPLASSDHVWADERLADEPGSYHVRNDAVKRLPFVRFVMQAHDYRKLLHAPYVADFAERILERVRAEAVVK